LEPFARAAYEAANGCWIDETSLVLTDDGCFGYSSDGLRGDDGMVEIKIPAACDKLGAIWSNPETAHEEYIDQMNGGLWITGRKYIDLVVYCPWLESVGKELFVKRIWRDDAAINALESDLIEFRSLVNRYESILRAAPGPIPCLNLPLDLAEVA
jgi:hypothetical protein